MNRAASLSGDTLLACHFPLAQLSPWQLPVQQALCGSAHKRLASGLTRAASLPERDCLRWEAASPCALRHTASTYCSLQEDRGEEEEEEEEEGGSDGSARCDSASSPEEAPQPADAPQRKRERLSVARGGASRSRNSFLPSVEAEEREEEEEEEGDEDSDGDNLHGYREDSSLVLHGNSNWASGFASRPAQSHNRLDGACSTGCVQEGALDGACSTGCVQEGALYSACSTGCVQEGALYRRPGESDTLLTGCECDAQGWGGEDSDDDALRYNGEACCFGYGRPGRFPPASLSDDGRPDCVVVSGDSSSSCDSSDGVLVTFSAIYDRSNNPATPNDLGSPAVAPRRSSRPAEGSVFLNLRPLHHGTQGDDRIGSSPQAGAVPSAPSWSPEALDSNCNLYPPKTPEEDPPQDPQDPQDRGVVSLEASGVIACLQGAAAGATQRYYKLVTCDLSSQSSHSPAWSSLTSSSPPPAEGPGGGASPPPAPPPEEYFLFGEAGVEEVREGRQQDGEPQREMRRTSTPVPTRGFHRPCCGSSAPSSRHIGSFAEMVQCKSQGSGPSQDLCPIQEALPLGQSSRPSPLTPSPGQGGSDGTTHPSACVKSDQERCETGAEMEGACPWEPPVVRYSLAQRPTSLPVQPFALLSLPGKPSQNQPLGSLLDRYIRHQNTGGPGHAQHGAQRSKGKGHRLLLTHLQPSPPAGYGPALLEAPSSSDTCSTCTPPSPDRRRGPGSDWAQGSTGQRQTCVSPNRPPASPSPSPSPSPGLILPSPKLCYTRIACAHTGIYQTQTYTTSPDQTRHNPAQTRPSPVDAPICYDLVSLSPVRTHASVSVPVKPPGPPPLSPHSPRRPGSSHTPPVSPPSGGHAPRDPGPLVSLLLTPPPLCSLHGLTGSTPSSSVAPPSSLSASLSALPPQESAGSAGRRQRRRQPDDSSSALSDRPPVEFSLSPDASYESLSISHLQRRGLLRSVSLAVDLIMAHFGTSRDPKEKIRLGNSSRSPTVGGLVLEHLCPTLQNVLQDGLRDHRLDLIVGQRPNHAWSVVEAATQTGPTTRVLHSLVTKVRQCPLLVSPGVRLRAFIMGLLNLRALEFWLSHLHSRKDVVTAHYHPWGFLPMSQGRRCRPLFRELLLLLQPLSALPFQLNLLTEPRLLQIGQLCCEERGSAPPPPPDSASLMTRRPALRAHTRPGGSSAGEGPGDERFLPGGPCRRGGHLQGGRRELSQSERWEGLAGGSGGSMWSAPSPGWWQSQPAHVEGVAEAEDCSHDDRDVDAGARDGTEREMEEREGEEREREAPRATADLQDESLSQGGGLRWAKLFGSGADPSSRTQRGSSAPSFNGTQTKKRPSHWLRLDRSQLGLLAQSVWAGRRPGPVPGPGPD